MYVFFHDLAILAPVEGLILHNCISLLLQRLFKVLSILKVGVENVTLRRFLFAFFLCVLCTLRSICGSFSGFAGVVIRIYLDLLILHGVFHVNLVNTFF